MTPEVANGAAKMLVFIVRFHHEHGRGPTYGVLMETFSLSRSGVKRRLDALRDKGFVEWDDKTRGTIRPVVREVRHRPHMEP